MNTETLPARRTLYDIGDDMRIVEDMLIASGGDVSDPEVEAAITAWIEENSAALSKKADGYLCLHRDIEARATAREAEAERLTQLAQIDRHAADRLKERLHFFMRDHGIKKLETERFRATLCNNGGKV